MSEVTKPLFVPLNSEHYDNFHNGSKTFELRQGPKRWNSKTVYTGRQVIISKGYGKQNRMNGNIGYTFRFCSLFNLLFHDSTIAKGSLWRQIMPHADSFEQAFDLAKEIYPKNGNFIAFECLDLKEVSDDG